MKANDETHATTIIGRDDVAAVIAAVGLDALMDQMIEGLTTAIVTFDDSVTRVRERGTDSTTHIPRPASSSGCR